MKKYYRMVPKTAVMLIECLSSFDASQAAFFINQRTSLEASSFVSGPWRQALGLGNRSFLVLEARGDEEQVIELVCRVLKVSYGGSRELGKSDWGVFYLLTLEGWEGELKGE